MRIAGKTGTATESSNTNVQPTAWFVAFGPTTSAPRYVVAVVIDQAGYGAAAAAPVAKQIFTYLTNHPIGSPDLHPPSKRSLIGLTGPMVRAPGTWRARCDAERLLGWRRTDQVDD